MKKTIKMDWSKSTKGTHVYSNSEPDTPVSTIYINWTLDWYILVYKKQIIKI